MNILICSIGKRGYLVKYFKKALSSSGNVITANSMDSIDGLRLSDKFYKVPFCYEDGYMESILKICAQEDIDLLFSLHDAENYILSQHLNEIRDTGCRPVVCDPEVVDICLDKFKTYEFLIESGARCPLTFIHPSEALSAIKRGECEFPLIVKERFGSGSVGQLLVESKEELALVINYMDLSLKRKDCLPYSKLRMPRWIIQEVMKGDEYNLQVINNLEGRYETSIQMKTLSRWSSEADHVEITNNKNISDLSKRLSRKLRHIGILDCDLFLKDKIPYVLELNPRFSGSYPFAHEAGLDLTMAFTTGFGSYPNDVQIGKKYCKEITLK